MCCARAIAAFCLGTAALTLPGCLVIPVPHGRPEDLSDKQLAWMAPGVTTRRDFILTMGDPHFRQRNDSIFIYASDVTAFVVAIGDRGATIPKIYFLLVRFDARGLLEEHRMVDTIAKDPCAVTGFCDPLPARP